MSPQEVDAFAAALASPYRVLGAVLGPDGTGFIEIGLEVKDEIISRWDFELPTGRPLRARTQRRVVDAVSAALKKVEKSS